MKVRDVLKKSAVMVVDIVEKKEDYITLATIDYHMNNKEGLHIDGKYYSSSVYLDLERPDIMDMTVDFFTAGTLFGYNDRKSYIGLTIYVK
jgi:hypothetical protein